MNKYKKLLKLLEAGKVVYVEVNCIHSFKNSKRIRIVYPNGCLWQSTARGFSAFSELQNSCFITVEGNSGGIKKKLTPKKIIKEMQFFDKNCMLTITRMQVIK